MFHWEGCILLEIDPAFSPIGTHGPPGSFTGIQLERLGACSPAVRNGDGRSNLPVLPKFSPISLAEHRTACPSNVVASAGPGPALGVARGSLG